MVLYIGVTDNIEERVKEHKLKIFRKSFTVRYNCDRSIYFEEFNTGDEVNMIEKQFEKWKRDWKINLLEEMYPNWTDLSLDWNKNLIN